MRIAVPHVGKVPDTYQFDNNNNNNKKKKKFALVFKTERIFQAIINSFKLVVKDKTSKTTKAHTIIEKGNKKYFALPYKC